MGTSPRPSLRSVILRVGAAFVVATLLAVAGCASGPQPGPTAVPLRPTETAEFEVADVQALMTQMLDAGAPAVFVEIRDGEQVWNDVQGVRSKKTELPASITDPVRIASLTKPMIATILLQLVEEQQVQLGDAIEEYLPGVVGGREVTIRQLLNHSSGMPDYVSVLALADPGEISAQIVESVTHEELVERALTQEWTTEPGTGFEYSNTNYIVLSMLIEQLTGNTLSEELQTRIAEPLGLAHTSLPVGTEMPEDAAHGYVVEGALSIDVTEQNASLWSGAGGVVSTVSDVNTFMRALLTGQVISPELLGEMLVLLPEGYGLGVQSRTDTCPAGDPVYLASAADDGAADDAADNDAADDGASDDGASDGAATDASGPAESPDAESGAPTESQGAAGDADTESQGAAGDADTESQGAAGDADSETGAAATGDAELGFDFEPPAAGSGSRHDSEYGEFVQIGAPSHVYGHLGSGLGYRGLTMSSPDGMRQVTILWTVSPTDYAEDARLPLAYELADLALSLEC